MTSKAIKIAVTCVVLAGALAGLMYTTLAQGTEYYIHVDEVMSSPRDWQGKRLQLHGFVVTNSILRKRDSLDYKFKVQNKGTVVDATYNGVVPDTFKDTPGTESEVVLKGQLTPDGFKVDRDGVMAKCPSKYQPKSAAPSL